MFRLAHLSDPPLGPLPDTRIRELLSKRVIGYVNWHRSRARSMTATWLDGIVEDIHESAPDHIAVTGDLVDGSVSRLAHDVEPFSGLTARHGVYFVTGNHDFYSGADSWP